MTAPKMNNIKSVSSIDLCSTTMSSEEEDEEEDNDSDESEGLDMSLALLTFGSEENHHQAAVRLQSIRSPI